jgi:DNA-binding response OmpR family regulator
MNPATGNQRRALVLEPDDQLASDIGNALREVAPGVTIDRTQSLQDAQRAVIGTKPDLFVLDLDAAPDLGQDFLYDLRTSHPHARAIILTAAHPDSVREKAAGLGAIHLFEKPFPQSDFVDLVQALLQPEKSADPEKFQGTLSDLHIADIIQLKCMSGATAAVEFTGPSGEKGRVYFEHGQVRHATAGGREGIEAFNEIVSWQGGHISEVEAEAPARTIDREWQHLIMDAVRNLDETRAKALTGESTEKTSVSRKVLVIDDSLMLLSFVKDILGEAQYEVETVPTAAEGLQAAKRTRPDLILLDYVLPDMKGDEITRRLREEPWTQEIPVVYMSGIGVDLQIDPLAAPNVIGFLNKPFTSDLLIKTVGNYMPNSPDEHSAKPSEPDDSPSAANEQTEAEPAVPDDVSAQETVAGSATSDAGEWWSSPQPQPAWSAAPAGGETSSETAGFDSPAPVEEPLLFGESAGGSYFCGDTRFFSLNWALQTIAKCKLTGFLRLFWNKEPVDLLVRHGEVVLVTTRDPELYCSEAPITLVNVAADIIDGARAQQRETGRPLFITLAEGGHILEEPAAQLVQHYGQKLFAQLWTADRVRFTFEQSDNLPYYANEVPAEGDIDHWELSTLRLIQFQDLGNKATYDINSIPAYTRDGFDRVQRLRLTVAEAQFASQFNGVRSVAQIAKNLRLDLKFARLTLFRFLGLEIVECWPASTASKPERKSVLQRLGRTIGLGE